MKIVILDGHALNPGDMSWGFLKKYGQLTVYDRTPADKVVGRIGDAEIIFLNKVNITREIFASCPNLKYIGVLATGYNVIDIKAAKEFGVTVTNIPSYSTMAVAQATFALLFELTNGIHLHNESVQNGGWIQSPDFCYWTHPLTEIAGKTFGIVGFGSIGQRVAKIASAFGMNVIVHTRTAAKVTEYKAVGKDELLSQSDIISLHCPLTESTQNFIDADAIAGMKDGAILLNTARGQLIDEAAVRAALDSKKLSGFAADVLAAEPMSKNNPLLGAPNCVITPHVAWAAKETRARLLDIARRNVEAFLAGKAVNVVS